MQVPSSSPDHINPDDSQSLARWVRELDATEAQLREAISKVGPVAADVEMHLKGSRSTTNIDRLQDAGGSSLS
jgi:hypothetical protein